MHQTVGDFYPERSYLPISYRFPQRRSRQAIPDRLQQGCWRRAPMDGFTACPGRPVVIVAPEQSESVYLRSET